MTTLFKKLRYAAYLLLGKIDMLIGRENKLFVMCYHEISTSKWPHAVKVSTFKKHISYLMNSGYTFITPQEFEDYLYSNTILPEKSVLLTFDDGCKSLLNVTDFLKEKRIVPIVFVLSDIAHADLKQIGLSGRKFMSVKDIKFLKKNGWTIGCHSATHSDFYRITDVEKETSKSVKFLSEKLSHEVRYFAYPRGRYTKEIQKKLKKAGIKIAFSMDDGKINLMTDRFAIPRIAYTSSHSFNEFKYSFAPSVVAMRSIVKKLFNRYL